MPKGICMIVIFCLLLPFLALSQEEKIPVYAIQLGAFSTREEADVFAGQVKDQGLDPIWQTRSKITLSARRSGIKTRKTYKVVYGRYINRFEARAAKNTMKKAGFTDCFMVRVDYTPAEFQNLFPEQLIPSLSNSHPEAAGDPYIALTTDTARLMEANEFFSQSGLIVKEIRGDGGRGLVVGPFLHGAMAYENLQYIKIHYPGAVVLRLSQSETRLDYVSPQSRVGSEFILNMKLGYNIPPRYQNPDWESYEESLKELEGEFDYLTRLRNIKETLPDNDPRKGIVTKLEADHIADGAFTDVEKGQATIKDAEDLYIKLIRGEVATPRDMRAHAAIRLYFIKAIFKYRTTARSINLDAYNPEAYFKAYQVARDAYEFLDDEYYRPEVAAYMLGKLLELAYRFDIGNYAEVRETIQMVKSDLPSSDSVRAIRNPIIEDREALVEQYRYFVSTLDLMNAETYIFEGDHAKAYEFYKDVAEKYPDIIRNYLSALRWQGYLANGMGRRAEAIQSLKTVVEYEYELTTKNTFARDNPRSNAAFFLGQIYLEENRVEETKELYEWTLNKFPDCREKENIEKCLEKLAQ